MRPLLDGIIEAAHAAGREICRVYRGDLDVQIKRDRSPVTAADHAAERVILERLAQLAPDVPVVAEERVAAGEVPAIGRRLFLVDPLDGTREFLSGNGEFTVNIALVEGGAPTLGVVYAPVASMLYAGDTTVPAAFRMRLAPDDGEPRAALREPIRVRATPPADDLVAVASRSHRDPATDAYLARCKVARIISVGSSLKFCRVAEGEADLYPRASAISEWDTAAGHALVVAAGGKVLDTRGVPLRYGKPGFRSGPFVAAGGIEPPIFDLA
ncbi:MAG: 3'(2'),5'-bisphosphate nucleotidase CysQ [Steroidobacteraceae bacterium]